MTHVTEIRIEHEQCGECKHWYPMPVCDNHTSEECDDNRHRCPLFDEAKPDPLAPLAALRVWQVPANLNGKSYLLKNDGGLLSNDEVPPYVKVCFLQDVETAIQPITMLMDLWRKDGAACRRDAAMDAYTRGCADAIELRVDELDAVLRTLREKV